jgi:hypothetical protein
MKAHALFGRMSELVDRLNGLRLLAQQRRAKAEGDKALAEALRHFEDAVDALRRQVVATKEGGAVTGEERLREHLDDAYGALMSYEGRPGDYQVERVAVLERELAEVESDTQKLVQAELPALNQKLDKAGAQPIAMQEALETGLRFAALDAYARRDADAVAAARDAELEDRD